MAAVKILKRFYTVTYETLSLSEPIIHPSPSPPIPSPPTTQVFLWKEDPQSRFITFLAALTKYLADTTLGKKTVLVHGSRNYCGGECAVAEADQSVAAGTHTEDC